MGIIYRKCIFFFKLNGSQHPQRVALAPPQWNIQIALVDEPSKAFHPFFFFFVGYFDIVVYFPICVLQLLFLGANILVWLSFNPVVLLEKI
jgi:hypothetical protein